jgi:hypothetical protein
VIFAAGSNITSTWGDQAFSTDDSGQYIGGGSTDSGGSLWTAYTNGSKAGTYTLSGTTWTQDS